jgi:hypothetical protein
MGSAEDAPAGTAGKPGAQASAGKRARVVLVRDREVLGEGRQVNARVIARMLDDAVTALVEEPSAEKAWSRLVRPADTVGIKSNEWEFLPTPPELEEILRIRVARAGVAADRIDIGDRGILERPVFQRATALINVRPLRTHHWSGVGSCIKNYIMFTKTPWDWHGDSCADLAGLWDLPAVKGKTRLNILVLLTPLFHGKGAHHYQAEYTWEYRGLIAGTDVVAVDATGLRILEAKRRAYFGENLPLSTPAKHIQVAQDKFRLGVSDPSRIEVVKLGWEEDALI